VYFMMKKWNEAKEYPEFIALTAGFDSKAVKDRWPGMKAFLVECYTNGAKCPPGLQKLIQKQDGAGAEPKAEAKKADEPKAEEKKTAEPKAEAKTPEPAAKTEEKK
jgi:hypothetical protein